MFQNLKKLKNCYQSKNLKNCTVNVQPSGQTGPEMGCRLGHLEFDSVPGVLLDYPIHSYDRCSSVSGGVYSLAV